MAHLTQRGLTRERVLACAVRLLDLGFFRIGTEGYAEQNDTYGLATMGKRHVRLAGDVVTFDYRAKNGKRRVQSVVDPEVVTVVTALKRRQGGGKKLLAYRDGRRWVDVGSADINSYLREVSGAELTAKDFRTWNATVLAAVALAVSEGATTPVARKRAIARAMAEVSHYLGNTPAIARASYVDPRLVDCYNAGRTISRALDRIGEETPFGQLSTQGAIERAVISLLARQRSEGRSATRSERRSELRPAA
jgi:DNA topoisomerase IB